MRRGCSGIGPLADVRKSVQLTEAFEVLEFYLHDIGKAAARLQDGASRLIFRVSLAGIQQFNLDVWMSSVKHVDLKLEIRHPMTTALS